MLRELLNLVRALSYGDGVSALRALGRFRKSLGGIGLLDELDDLTIRVEARIKKGDFRKALRELTELTVELQEVLDARTRNNSEDLLAFYEAALFICQGDVEAFRKAVKRMAFEIKKRFGGLWSLAHPLELMADPATEDAGKLTRMLEAFAAYYSHILVNYVRTRGRSIYLMVSSLF